MTVEMTGVPAPMELEAEWRALEAAADGSFFLTWDWVGLWLGMLPEDLPRHLVRAREGGRTVGLAIFCENIRRRSGMIRSRALFLHTTGRPELDELTLEYNGVLAERGREGDVLAAMLGFLAGRREWEELYFDGWYRSDLLPGLRMPGTRLLPERVRPYHFVDLQALREGKRPYVETLSAKSRYRVKRTLREFTQATGAAVFRAANGVAEGLEFLGELKRLHQETWRARGMPGAFANDWFDRFHARLVAEGSARGFVQLVRLSMGERPVGLLYNFLYRGRVYVYQTGFDYVHAAGASKWSPGLLCHSFAVELNRELGHHVYDFMAGDSRYKRELASSSGDMGWYVLQRPRLKFRLHDLMRAAKRRMRSREQAAPAVEEPAT